jgi:hypothetical protein
LDLFSIHCCAFSLFRTHAASTPVLGVRARRFLLLGPPRLLVFGPSPAPVASGFSKKGRWLLQYDDGEQKEGQLHYSFLLFADMRDKDMAACYCSLSRSCQPFFIPFKIQLVLGGTRDASSYLETRSLGGRQATGAGVATRWSRGSCPILLH